jgi:hypothetical protein
MRSLYDVFAAICADEGDHVCAMAACLDTNATLQSPSIERRVLIGIASLAFVSYALSTYGSLDVDVIDTAGTTTIGDTAAAFTDVAAAAGFSRWAEDDAESLKGVFEGGGNAIRTPFVEQLRRFGTELARFFARMI